MRNPFARLDRQWLVERHITRIKRLGAKGVIESYPSGAEGIRGGSGVGVSLKIVYSADGRVMREVR
jgi:hypothetical protein